MADVTLDFLGAQLQRVLDDIAVMHNEIAGFRDDMRVLSAMTLRVDNKLDRLEDEIHRMNGRVRRLEEVKP